MSKTLCDYCGKKKHWWQRWACLGSQAGYYDFCTSEHERFFKIDALERHTK